MTEQVSVLFNEIAELAISLEAVPLSQYEGCWEYRIDDRWEIAVNGHDKAIECSHGTTVEPFHAYVLFNGFPAGIVSPFGGVIAAGDAANEHTLIEAIRKNKEGR